MRPYYEHGGVTIYHGDAREVLPGLVYDALVTDPPYGIRYVSGRRPEPLAGDDAFPLWIFDFPGRVASLVFVPWVALAAVPEPDGYLVWDKLTRTAGDLEHNVARQWEGIAFYAGRAHAFADGRPQDVLRYARCDYKTAEAVGHPTQKPEALMKHIVQMHDGSVCDPFMGSGTTLVAAKQLGRRAIGIEIEERYCEMAAQRLAQEVMALA